MGRIQRIAIANRGEVACRIIRACQELNIETILLHSEADVKTRAYRMADRAICIGPSPVAESYLNIERTVQGAVAGGAQALHPGFGFLSENADFAKACALAGIKFIGPPVDAIELLGDKMASKTLAKQNQVPMIPGYQGEDQSLQRLINEAERIGYPVIAKAAAGGGGRGMKVIRSTDEAADQIASAQREGQASFGSPVVFLEKYLDKAKHIEFQVFADGAGTYHLYDRECSVQRRHQKLIEEACSPSISDELRQTMGEAAVRLCRAAGYISAGTVEFLVQDNQYYFLEVNTRLQVEHPVTEMVLGVDLVKAQIQVARGRPAFHDLEFHRRGHAIECRINAEDPYNNGVPSTGTLGSIVWPYGPHRRFEFGFEKDDEITSFYDSMIAKVIVWDETRSGCIEKMKKTLEQSIVFGVHTNIALHWNILSHPDFVDGSMTTRFIDQNFPEGLDARPLSDEQQRFAETARRRLSGRTYSPFSPFSSFWRSV